MNEQKPELGEIIRNIRRFFAFPGIYFILFSQFLIFSSPVNDSVLIPPYTWTAVFGLIVLISSQLIRRSPIFQKISTWLIFQERAFWLIAAFLLFALATAANFVIFTRLNYIPVVSMWLLAAGVYFYAFFNSSLDVNAVLEWVRKNRVEILSVVAVTLIAAGRTPALLCIFLLGKN